MHRIMSMWCLWHCTYVFVMGQNVWEDGNTANSQRGMCLQCFPLSSMLWNQGRNGTDYAGRARYLRTWLGIHSQRAMWLPCCSLSSMLWSQGKNEMEYTGHVRYLRTWLGIAINVAFSFYLSRPPWSRLLKSFTPTPQSLIYSFIPGY